MNKKIALFSFIPPYPIVSGAHLRIWENLKILSRNNDVLLIIYKNANFPIDIDMIKKYVQDILIIDLYPVNRINNAIRLLNSFIKGINQYSQQYINQETIALITDKLTKYKPDISIFESSYLSPLILNLNKYTGKTIVDLHNVEHEILYQFIKLKISPLYKLRQYTRYKMVKKLEININNIADQIWVVSQRDKMIMETLIGKISNKIFIIPNAININNYKTVTSKHEYTIAFMAGFKYEPNSKAAEIIIKHIFPKVKKTLRDAKLLFIGSSPTPFMIDAANRNKDITITGFVQNIDEYLSRVAIVIVPLIMGGGTRFKILEALALGKPVISTPKGAEGLDLVNGKSIVICDLKDFPDKIIELMQNPNQLNSLIINGKEDVKKYSTEVLNNNINNAIAEL